MESIRILKSFGELASKYGKDILSKEKQFSNLLMTYCADNPQEGNIILSAYREGIVTKIEKNNEMQLTAMEVEDLSLYVQKKTGLLPESSKWAVEIWIEALEIFNRKELSGKENIVEDQPSLENENKLFTFETPPQKPVNTLLEILENTLDPNMENSDLQGSNLNPSGTPSTIDRDKSTIQTCLPEYLINPDSESQGLAYQIGFGKILKIFSLPEKKILIITDNSVFIFDWQNNVYIYKVISSFKDGDFNQIKSFLFGVDKDFQISIWDIENNKFLRKIVMGREKIIKTLAISPGSFYLVTNGQLRLCKNENSFEAISGIMLFEYCNTDIVTEPSKKSNTLEIIERRPIERICFCEDNLLALSILEDCRVCLYTFSKPDNEKPKVIEKEFLLGHTGAIRVFAYSKENSFLASSGEDQTIRLWDLEKKKQVFTFNGHAGLVECLTFSPDGQFLASGGQDGVICLWNTNTGAQITWFEGSDGPVTCISFSSDGKYLISVNNERIINIWEIASRKIINQVNGGAYLTQELYTTEDKQYVVYRDGNNTLRLWNWSNGQVINVPNVENIYKELDKNNKKQTPTSMLISPKGNFLALSGDHEISIWDIKTDKKILYYTHDFPDGVIKQIIFRPDEKCLFAAISRNEESIIVNMNIINQATSFFHPRLNDVEKISFEPNGQYLTIINANKNAETYFYFQQQLNKVDEINLVSIDKEISSTVFESEGNLIVTGHKNGMVRVWDLTSNQCVRRFAGHHSEVRGIDISPNGNRIASIGQDNQIFVWDTSSGKVLLQSKLPLYESNEDKDLPSLSIHFSPDGNYAITSGGDGVIYIWHIPAQQPERNIMKFIAGRRFDSYEENELAPKIGMTYLGTIKEKLIHGLIVEFMGNLQGFIPRSQVSNTNGEVNTDLNELVIGSKIKVMLVHYDPFSKIILSNIAAILGWTINQARANLPLENYNYIIGEIYPGKVVDLTSKESTGLLIELAPLVYGKIDTNEYNDILSNGNEIKPGDILQVMIIDHDEQYFVVSNLAVDNGWSIDKWKYHYQGSFYLGMVFTGAVKRVTDYGVFLEIRPGIEGMIHISQLDSERVERVTDLVNLGDELTSMITHIESDGKIRLSRQAVLEGWTLEEALEHDMPERRH